MKRNKFTALQLKWLKALESGEYRQGRNYLVQFAKGGDKFCCLGVACDVMGLKVDEDGYYDFNGQLENTCMPGLAWEKLFLRDVEGDAVSGIHLITLNDEGWSFKRIASLIRKKPWQYFTNFDVPSDA